MNIQLLIGQENSIILDISDLVIDISWETNLNKYPGKLTFSFVNDNTVRLLEGNSVDLRIDGTGIFFGFIFNRTKDNNDKVSIIAYDQLRYLKNKDTYVFDGGTASERFATICEDNNLNYSIVTPSAYNVQPSEHDDENGYIILENATDETLQYTGKWYIYRDNYGTLEFLDLDNLTTDLILGDDSLMLSYIFESSIDSDTYNQVKLVKDNEETGTREVYVTLDSSNINRWGLLQYYEKQDKGMNTAQMIAKAEGLLILKNRPTRKIPITALGDLRAIAGNGIFLLIADLQDEDVNLKPYLIQKAIHKFTNELHTMNLELKVI